MKTRIDHLFAKLKADNKKAFVAYMMAGAPDYVTSLDLLHRLPQSGVDIIEVGFPFSDPMADGPTIQKAGYQALNGQQTLLKTLTMVSEFRQSDQDTPIVLMGYYNPIHHLGAKSFLKQAKTAGVDGLIIVDLPPEEDQELCLPAIDMGLNFIRLATPTTDDERLPAVLNNASGFLYYVSLTGVTGVKEAQPSLVAPDVARLKAATPLPICVGFGVKTPEVARAIASTADGVVVGSSIIEKLQQGASLDETLSFINVLADATHNA